MKPVARLIHRSKMTYIPTNLPVSFYGLPDGNVYIIYARFYGKKSEKTEIEYVIAIHNQFLYNFKQELLIPKNKMRCPVYNEMVDNPDPDFTILQVKRNLRSYAEAVELLKGISFQYDTERNVC